MGNSAATMKLSADAALAIEAPRLFGTIFSLCDEMLAIERRHGGTKVRDYVAQMRNRLAATGNRREADRWSDLLKKHDRYCAAQRVMADDQAQGPTPEQRRRVTDNPMRRLLATGKITDRQMWAADQIRITVENQFAGSCAATVQWDRPKVDVSLRLVQCAPGSIDQSSLMEAYRGWCDAVVGQGLHRAGLIDVIAYGYAVRETERAHHLRNGTLMDQIKASLLIYLNLCDR